MFRVPVVNQRNEPLMPTMVFRAKRWVKSGRATPFWKMGIWCVRMNEEVGEEKQEVVVGVDPGLKREAFTVKSSAHTYINIQTDAINWITGKLSSRKSARKFRRYRKTPYRKCRRNRSKKNLSSPSIKARWDFKISIVKNIKKLYPIIKIIIENLKVPSRAGQANWNRAFSPLQSGKKQAYLEFTKLNELVLISGLQTSKLRKIYGLAKIYDKLSDKFEAHCVDSWVIANSVCEGKLDNRQILRIIPIQFHKRQLHVVNPTKNGIRKLYGSTRTSIFKRGTIVRHKKYGKCCIGGYQKKGITLYKLNSLNRISRIAKIEDCKPICYNKFIYRIINPK